MTEIDGQIVEIKMRNISAMGAQVECSRPFAPGAALTIDIVGVGPVVGCVRWAQAGRFGLQFDEPFDLSRLAPKQERRNPVTMLRPWYVSDRRTG